ncbi:MAG TPA: AraC family transcriptional regulator ligand-binding domain-containing protein [Nannocystaceae bacterium]|nr:AraC family transcriptional regulator ligand-binding domain-containing protein [Nannocystaceae bacterium]
MPATPTVAVTSTRAVIEAAGRRGADVVAILRAHEIDAAVLHDKDARLPVPTVASLWKRASMDACEPELPIHAAVELGWGSYRVIDMLAASAGTVGEGLTLVSQYFRIIHDTVFVPIRELPDGRRSFSVEDSRGNAIPAPYVDYTLAACLFRMQHAGAAPIDPEVHLRRAAPAELVGHHRAFGTNLRFSADSDHAVLTEAQWAAPMSVADPLLQSVLKDHADQLLRGLPDLHDPLADVQQVLLEGMPRGRVDLEHVAKQLGVSARTLQRRLADTGTSWSDVLEAARRELSARLLVDPSLSVDDVAVLLGYAEASAFHRAFRRWTGQTPGAFRKQRRPLQAGV